MTGRNSALLCKQGYDFFFFFFFFLSENGNAVQKTMAGTLVASIPDVHSRSEFLISESMIVASVTIVSMKPGCASLRV